MKKSLAIMPIPLSAHPDLATIKLLTCDVDGVLTDGGLYYGDNGERLKRFNVLDGQGLKDLQKAGVKICFISQSKNPSILARAKDLGIDYCYSGIEDKFVSINRLIDDIGLNIEEVAHIADDVNDLTLLKAVGIPITVPNAVDRVKNVCRFVTKQSGGQGAVRELCDLILQSKNSL